MCLQLPPTQKKSEEGEEGRETGWGGGGGRVQIGTSTVTPRGPLEIVQTPGFRRNKIWIQKGKGTQGCEGSKEHRGGDPPPSQPGLCALPRTCAQMDLGAYPKPPTASPSSLPQPCPRTAWTTCCSAPTQVPSSPSSRCLGLMPRFPNP